jgi:ligand-binding sensor domain-containing protein/signal transduction histidine kinase
MNSPAQRQFVKRRHPFWLKCLVGWGFLSLPCLLFALDPAKTIFQFNCRTWTREDGLSDNGINAITQTRDGFLWVGTQKGLARFDGIQFKPLPLPGDLWFRGGVISTLCRSENGGLWFGLRSSCFGYYSPATGFSCPTNEAWITPTMNTYMIHETADGAVWIGADMGTTRWVLNDTNATVYHTELPIGVTLCEGARGRVWVGTFERGLFYWEAGKVTAFPDKSLAKGIVNTVVEDRQGRLWVGTTQGLRCYDSQFQRVAIPEVTCEVKALLLDGHDRLWTGTTGMGVATYDGGTFHHLRRADGLPSDNVTALFEDREGSLWVGTRNGLCQLADVKLPILSSKDGIPGEGTHSVCASRDGGVWAATSAGLSLVHSNGIRNFSTGAGFPFPYLRSVFEAGNGDVFAVDSERCIHVLSEGRIVASHTNSAWVESMCEDARGMVVSISDRLYRASRKQLAPLERIPPNPPPFYWVFNLSMCRDDSILVSSANGLLRLTNGLVERWGIEDGLSDNAVFWAGEDPDGTIWAAMGTGIARIKGREIRNIAMTNGLHDNFILAIVPDDHGDFWFNSSRGIFRASRRMLNEFADGRIDRIECTAYDGIECVKVVDTSEVQRSGCKTADGRIWFPSPGGLIVINPTNLVQNSMAPPVHIEQARANGCELTGNKRPTVRPGKGELEFHYTAPSFIAPQKVRFRYVLEGYDPGWVEAGARRSAFYTNLKPGTYRFCVEACNADGVWNTTGDRIEIVLPPHFYETGWFKAFGAFLVFAVLAGLYSLRVRYLQKKQQRLQEANELLESKVREKTRELLDVTRRAGMAEVATHVLHNVGNVLNSVNVSASLLGNKIRSSSALKLDSVVTLLRDHERDLPEFLARDETGRRVVKYLEMINQRIVAENAGMLEEAADLKRNVEQINNIVAMQQVHGSTTTVEELFPVAALVDEALGIQAADYEQKDIRVTRDFAGVPQLKSDRHKLLQILICILKNARQACERAGARPGMVSVHIGMNHAGHVRIEIADNGVGIPAENLTRIFSQGFTTHENRAGFSLHTCAVAAQELEGRLTAASEGPGRGSTFILELPLTAKAGSP